LQRKWKEDYLLAPSSGKKKGRVFIVATDLKKKKKSRRKKKGEGGGRFYCKVERNCTVAGRRGKEEEGRTIPDRTGSKIAGGLLWREMRNDISTERKGGGPLFYYRHAGRKKRKSMHHPSTGS